MPPSKPTKFTYKSQRRAETTKKKSKSLTRPQRTRDVKYDEEARHEYLTGFSKRKQEKKAKARVRNEEKERQERNELRAQLRQQKKEQAAANVKAAQDLYGDADPENVGEVIGGPSNEDLEDIVYENDLATTRVTIEPLEATQNLDEPLPSSRKAALKAARQQAKLSGRPARKR